MIHTINELCTKINTLKIKADKLSIDNKAKEDGYSIPKVIIDEQIADIQYICNLIANDKSY